MRNVRINEAETIFEPFWDSGDTYPGHHKYSHLTEYRIETNGAGSVAVGWQSVQVTLHPNAGEDRAVRMTRACALNIAQYDRLRLFAAVPKSVRFSIACTIDGVEKPVVESSGNDTFKEYTGEIAGRMITSIRLEFRNMGGDENIVDLCWMGLSNAAREKEMCEEPSPYTPEWEGCFADEAEMTPQTGLFFDEAGLAALRGKLKSACFASRMAGMRAQAEAYLKLEPEKFIGEYVNDRYRNFVRDRDMTRLNLAEQAMNTLAFIGLVDQNREMLRMACRYALSVAHCKYFCESIMGNFPGATWHHRSFLEANLSGQILNVLDWAGGMLTWHGKNILYDAVINKGLPRIDGDIKTMDYIWTMNQGIVFASELVVILMGLQKRYPRYAVRVEEAERDLIAMWNNYVQADGGTAEGPAYWNFTVSHLRSSFMLLAKYHGKSLKDYAPQSLKKSALFAEAMLSDTEDETVPINDSHGDGYNLSVAGLMAALDAGDIWRKMNNRLLEGGAGGSLEDLIFAEHYPIEKAGEPERRPFLSFPCTGHTTLRRETPELGTVGLHAVSGIVTFGHAHSDKGSFILEAAGRALLIDRGCCAYGDPYVSMIGKAELHNVIVPVKDGMYLNQLGEDPAGSAKVLESRFEDGALHYSTDVKAAWGGVFDRNIRAIHSPDARHYEIRDSLKISGDYEVCFILNTNGVIVETQGGFLIADGGAQVEVKPRNWTPSRFEYGACGKDGKERPVNRLCLFMGGREEYELVTELVLSKRFCE